MMLLSSVLMILNAASALATSCATIIPPDRTGTLTVKALDLRGGQVADVEVQLYQKGRRVDVPLDKVQYGSYEMRLTARGFQIYSGNIFIDEPYSFSRVEVRIGDTCRAERTELAGTVAGQHPEDLWIKAVPLRGNGWTVESKVESKGGFSLRGLEPGEYVFLLTSESKVVHQVVHFVDASYRPLQLTLPEPK